MFNKNSKSVPIPFYILTFNRVKGLESAIEFSKRSTTELNIVIVDMGSTWPPFLELLDSGKYNVVRFPKGTHPRDLLLRNHLADLGDGGFFLSDGDIDYSETNSDAFEHLVVLSQEFPWIPKVGLELRTDILPKTEESRRILSWSKYSKSIRIKDDLYLASLDTTIAYYPSRGNRFYLRPALILGGLNSVIHYPWLQDSEKSDEEIFYNANAIKFISSGNSRPYPSIKFKFSRIIWVLFARLTRAQMRNRRLGKFLVRILSIKGVIKGS
jgi:hypothetical protein